MELKSVPKTVPVRFRDLDITFKSGQRWEVTLRDDQKDDMVVTPEEITITYGSGEEVNIARDSIAMRSLRVRIVNVPVKEEEIPT